jgi:hypothetical protein
MVTALTSSRRTPAGRHAAPKPPGGAKRGRLVGGALSVAAAIAAVAFIAMPARPTSNSTVPRFSGAQVQQLARATPAQRQAIDYALVASFSRYAKAGAGPMPAPGQPSLTAKSWSWGITGTHVWIIMSFTDIHNGALAGITGDCIAMFQVAKVGGFAWLCGGLEQLLAHLSYGYSPESNHGVWAALYWWPPKIQYGYW